MISNLPSAEVKSECDFTRPLNPGEKNGMPYLRNAQYSLLASPFAGGQRLKCREIGGGFSFDEAKQICAQLSALVELFYTRPCIYTAPSFTFELRKPKFIINGKAEVGDLILRPYTTGLGDRNHFIETNIAGQVADIDESGFPLSIRDRAGIYNIEKRPYFVFPAVQFNVAAAIQEMQARDILHLRDGHYGFLHGSYGSADLFGQALREYLIPLRKVISSNDCVSEILGYRVTLDNWTG